MDIVFPVANTRSLDVFHNRL